ncbi:MAG: hypothetical protein ACLFQT_05630 [Thiohalophilus sp.]
MNILLLTVALLVVINVWRWWPQVEEVTGQTSAPPEQMHNMTLNLAGYEPAGGELVEVKRDLFSPVDEAKPEPEPPSETVQTEEPPAGNTKRETEPEELARYKLVGVLSRNGIKQGFLVRGEDNFRVRHGDRLEQGFRVEEVTLTSVTLSDPESRTSKKIELE